MNNEIILEKLNDIEVKQEVKIILAAESGSRAWGFHSPDSDYDIRFIYQSKMNDYLSLWNGKDTIEFTTEDDLDGSGWDLKKALILLSKSNSQLIEWIHSPLIYKSDSEFLTELKSISLNCFNPIACYYHYASTAKNFIDSCLKDQVKLKNYFYLLRNLLAAKWIVEYNSFPPVLFEDKLSLVPPDIKLKIMCLLEIKSNSNESYLHPKDELLNQFIFSELEQTKVKSNTLKANEFDALELDKFFRKQILGK